MLQNIPRMEKVIVVLGYKNEACGKLHPIAIHRANKGVEVAKANIQRHQNIRLVCTGGFGNKFNQSNTAHGQLIQHHMQNKGLTKPLFLPHAPSHNTYEDGKFCAQITHSRKISEILLVTSDFHMKRGFLWFYHFNPGIKIHCCPAVTQSPETQITDSDMDTLIQHEKRAIKSFYHDFPKTPPLPMLYDWDQLNLPV